MQKNTLRTPKEHERLQIEQVYKKYTITIINVMTDRKTNRLTDNKTDERTNKQFQRHRYRV